MNIPDSRARILWIDDEISHLKPHILFLQDKGYTVTTTTNGADGVEILTESAVDIILLDHFMPGMDGLETLQRLKEASPGTPVIMITKSEEEWLMDEAIAGKIESFLIKPVNPTQIFMAIKQVLEKQEIQSKRITTTYLESFQSLDQNLSRAETVNDWWSIYSELVRWQLEFDQTGEKTLGSMLEEQFRNCNRTFDQFIENNYLDWLNSDSRPLISSDIISRRVSEEIDRNNKVCLVVIDSMKYDHFLTIKPVLENFFRVETEPQISLLPTATPFSRNSIFAGLFPDEIIKRYPQQKSSMMNHDPSLNQFEDVFLKDHLKRLKLNKKSTRYHKIWSVDEGIRIENRVSDYFGINFLTFVVNFVDILAHSRSESDILLELVPDEEGFRMAVKNWFNDSWLKRILQQLATQGYTVFLTSDHGSIKVNKGAVVKADKEASAGIRYKYGRNINCTSKKVLNIKRPDDYRLPVLEPQFNYLVAKSDIFLLYPNQYSTYNARLKGSFQHGGISLEEILVPFVKMTPL